MRPDLRKLLTVGLVGTPVGFLVYSFLDNWRSISEWSWDISIWQAFGSLLLLLFALSLQPLASQWILRALGHQLSYPKAYSSFFLSQLAKYLPGAIWVIPGRFLTYGRAGVDAKRIGISLGIEIWMDILVGLGFAFLVLVNGGSPGLTRSFGIAIIAILAVGAIGVFLISSTRVGAWMPAVMARMVPDAGVLRSANLVAPALLYIIYWAAVGSAYFALVVSLSSLELSDWAPMIGVFAASWVAGVLVVFAPAGLGVREATMAVLLAPYVPLPLTIVLPLLARLWWSAGEALSIGLAFALAGRDLGDAPRPSSQSEHARAP